MSRDHSVYAPSHWEMALQCNTISQWLGAYCMRMRYEFLCINMSHSSPLVPHIFFGELGQHWFRQWFIACTVTSHYLNQCWVILKWMLRNKHQWHFNQNTKLFIHKNASEYILCKKAAILSGRRWVKHLCVFSIYLGCCSGWNTANSHWTI